MSQLSTCSYCGAMYHPSHAPNHKCHQKTEAKLRARIAELEAMIGPVEDTPDNCYTCQRLRDRMETAEAQVERMIARAERALKWTSARPAYEALAEIANGCPEETSE